jgi:hypothetical protein
MGIKKMIYELSFFIIKSAMFVYIIFIVVIKTIKWDFFPPFVIEKTVTI